MTTAVDLLIGLLKDGWTAIVTFLLLAGLIGILVTVLRAAGSAVIGSRYGFSAALGAISGIFFILLFAFLGLPVVFKAVQSTTSTAAGCAPLFELGAAATAIVAGLAAVRMLIAVARGLSISVVSGDSPSKSLLEIGEAVFGMLLVLLVVPISVHFLGNC